MKNYFITGISGFVGRNLLDILIKDEGTHIYGLVFPNEQNLDSLLSNNSITLVPGNILNHQDIESFLSKDVDGEKIVIHIAGMISVYKNNDPKTFMTNVEGTKNMVDASIKYHVDKFIFISSVDALSRVKGNDKIYEQDYYYEDKVEGVYSKSKVAANNYILDKVKENKINAVILCPSALMGPNDPFNAPINDSIRKFLNNKLPAIVKGGYDIVDVRDVAFGIYSSIKNGRNGESYILSGTYISVKDLIGIAAQIANKKPVKFVVPHFIIKMISPFIEMHAKRKKKKPLFTGFSMDCLKQNSNYSHEKATKELGYNHRDIKETIKDTVDWITSQKSV